MKQGNDRHVLSADGVEALLRLLVNNSGERISSAVVDGRRVWIKRYDAARRPLAKRLHAIVSPIFPHAFLRASREVGMTGLADREERKMRAFREAGFLVPDMVYRRGPVLVLSDIAPTVEDSLGSLRQDEEAGHDALLVDCARTLGEVHAAHLCHGRPHPRDLFSRDGKWGFLDFEEEPEAVMPLAAAQARDVWLLFLQIAARACLEGTRDRALDEYRKSAPAQVMTELRRIVRFFGIAVPPLRLLEHVYLGGDGRRVLQATEFLMSALLADPAPSMAADEISRLSGEN